TNAYGFYSISLLPGTYSISVFYLGYEITTQTVDLSTNQTLHFNLVKESTIIEEVVVSDTRKDANVNNTQMGTLTLSTDQIKKLPMIFGESDILKAVQLLPGVQSAGEGQAGFYVRGGGPDQN